MLFDDVREIIEARDSFDAWEEYAENYEQHTALREQRCAAFVAEDWGDVQQIRSVSLVLKQALLHRAINLFEGALYSAASQNFHSMVLSIRGHFETTASLGYLHSRLNSLKRATIEASTFHHDIGAQVLGSREGGHAEAPNAKQILSMLQHADKSVSINLLGGSATEHDILTDSYLWLSEFCHPNFHSNSISLDVDNTVPEFRFRHDKPMRDRECKVLPYLLLSGPIFVALFDEVGKLLDETLPDPKRRRL